MNEHPMPLATILTRRLIWIAVAVLVVNAVAVGIYYGSDRQALQGEVIERVMEQLEADLGNGAERIDRQTRALFEANPGDYGFAVIQPDNTVLDSANVELIPKEALDTGIFAQNWLTRQETAQGRLLVASHKVRAGEENLRVVFVMAGDPAGLLRRALVAEFITHIWLPILPTALILIAVNALMIRRGIKPVVEAARWARSIKPGAPPPPLQGQAFPREIVDLVTATHRSLERLNEALASEKRRTAEAAHALRTPVSVLFARLDAVPAGAGRDQLRSDLTHLSRTVNQLLACARADELTVPDTCRANLESIASKVTAALAPFAYEQGVTLSLSTAGSPVIARADPDAVELALTNLVENAILHGGHGEVDIAVSPDSTITVCDQGPGLSSTAMARMFELFWRGEGAPPGARALVWRSLPGSSEHKAVQSQRQTASPAVPGLPFPTSLPEYSLPVRLPSGSGGNLVFRHKQSVCQQKEHSMKDVRKLNLKQTGDWLAEEIEICVTKKWLVISGVVFLVLLILAFD